MYPYRLQSILKRYLVYSQTKNAPIPSLRSLLNTLGPVLLCHQSAPLRFQPLHDHILRPTDTYAAWGPQLSDPCPLYLIGRFHQAMLCFYHIPKTIINYYIKESLTTLFNPHPRHAVTYPIVPCVSRELASVVRHNGCTLLSPIREAREWGTGPGTANAPSDVVRRLTCTC